MVQPVLLVFDSLAVGADDEVIVGEEPVEPLDVALHDAPAVLGVQLEQLLFVGFRVRHAGLLSSAGSRVTSRSVHSTSASRKRRTRSRVCSSVRSPVSTSNFSRE